MGLQFKELIDRVISKLEELEVRCRFEIMIKTIKTRVNDVRISKVSSYRYTKRYWISVIRRPRDRLPITRSILL